MPEPIKPHPSTPTFLISISVSFNQRGITSSRNSFLKQIPPQRVTKASRQANGSARFLNCDWFVVARVPSHRGIVGEQLLIFYRELKANILGKPSHQLGEIVSFWKVSTA